MFGTFNIFKLAELMYMCFTGDEQVIDIWDSTKEVVEELPTSRKCWVTPAKCWLTTKVAT